MSELTNNYNTSHGLLSIIGSFLGTPGHTEC